MWLLLETGSLQSSWNESCWVNIVPNPVINVPIRVDSETGKMLCGSVIDCSCRKHEFGSQHLPRIKHYTRGLHGLRNQRRKRPAVVFPEEGAGEQVLSAELLKPAGWILLLDKWLKLRERGLVHHTGSANAFPLRKGDRENEFLPFIQGHLWDAAQGSRDCDATPGRRQGAKWKCLPWNLTC